jgi:hypothetical protein
MQKAAPYIAILAALGYLCMIGAALLQSLGHFDRAQAEEKTEPTETGV